MSTSTSSTLDNSSAQTPSLPSGSEQTPSLPSGSEQTPSLPPGSEQARLAVAPLMVAMFLGACSASPPLVTPLPPLDPGPTASEPAAPEPTATADVPPADRPRSRRSDRKPSEPEIPKRLIKQHGVASWYGPGFHRRRTANGEIYDMDGVTAAHRELPFGTIVRVHNLDNGLSLDVRINDRGPFVKGRILDLSRGAAEKLGMIREGTARVELEVLSLPHGLEIDTPLVIQVGAFRDRALARQLLASLSREWPNATIHSDGGWYRVQIRNIPRRNDAEILLASLKQRGHQAFIVEPGK